jgi:hypothetical protein
MNRNRPESCDVAALEAEGRLHGRCACAATLSLRSNAATVWVALILMVSAALPLAAADSPDAWVRYFPDRPEEPADEAGWAELARAFPNRVKHMPAQPAAPQTPPVATRIEVRPGIAYVRVRNLANDLDAIQDALAQPRLIIDLRYIHGELAESLRLGTLIARRDLAIEPRATDAPQPEPATTARRPAGQLTLCLVNRGTSGPIEAVLDALQGAGDILLVGTQSAGDTGFFRTADQAPAWRVIADDYRRENGPSLLDVGVTPALFVETTPDAEDAAYIALDAGQPVADLLDAPVRKSRFDEARLQQQFAEIHPKVGKLPVPTPSPATPLVPPESEPQTPDADTPPGSATPATSLPGVDSKPVPPTPFDRSLQRAVSTLVAHAIFHPAPPAAAGK